MFEQIAALFSFDKGILTVGGKEPAGAGGVFREARRLWLHPQAKRKSLDARAAGAAAHILSHLPDQHGCTVQALAAGIGRFGLEAGAEKLAQFCSDGWQGGFLARSGRAENRSYAATPAPCQSPDAQLGFSADAQGVWIDAGQACLEGLFDLAGVQRDNDHAGDTDGSRQHAVCERDLHLLADGRRTRP